MHGKELGQGEELPRGWKGEFALYLHFLPLKTSRLVYLGLGGKCWRLQQGNVKNAPLPAPEIFLCDSRKSRRREAKAELSGQC